MLNISQIESFYPEHMRHFKRNLLREYLQYKTLEIIFDSKFGDKLSLIGETAIHIVHSSLRFSEDLDFDNLVLKEKDFIELTELLKYKLKLEGYVLEIKNIFKKAYRVYLQISDILFENNLSNYKEEKLTIQIDTEPQKIKYELRKIIINKFDIFLRINVVPLDILLSQKIYAIFNRKRPIGRDFYDIVFLSGKTRPNFDYLKVKLSIKNAVDLKDKLLQKCGNLDFNQLAKDVIPFLFDAKDAKNILFFVDYIKDHEF